MPHDETQAQGSAAQQAVERIMQEACEQSDGLHGMLLSTSDGQTRAMWLSQRGQAGRLSAMASSLLALAETMARETGQQQCRYTILDNTDGLIVCLRVNARLTLTCLGNARISLGMLLSAGKLTAERIHKTLKS